MLVAIKEVGEAGSQLPDLVRQVEAGNEVVLTRNGCHVARLMPLTSSNPTNEPPPYESKMALMDRIRKAGARKALSGPDGAHSQDFLYDESGLPA